MKRLGLLALPLFLTACAAQNTMPPEPAIGVAVPAQCVADCETIHAGQVRACTRQPVTQGRSGMQFNQCVGGSYEALGVCYSGCATDTILSSRAAN